MVIGLSARAQGYRKAPPPVAHTAAIEADLGQQERCPDKNYGRRTL